MRNLAAEFKEGIINNKNYNFCYEITFKNKTKLYLTSASKLIIDITRLFYPYSGMEIIKAKFTDSGKDYVLIKGIFEELGITRNSFIMGANIKIYINLNNSLKPLIDYCVTNFIKHDLNFIIKLESEAIKYNQSITKQYSKTCRANLGDLKCKVDLKEYSTIARIIKIDHKILIFASLDCDDGYYDGGSIYSLDNILITKIISQKGNEIEILEEDINVSIQINVEVTLIPGCDKTFISCCNKYNNAVNFRGEPFIPNRII